MNDTETARIRHQIKELRIEHLDLDYAITQLVHAVHVDDIRLRRLKKRKLALKDQIQRLESKLIPDLDA